MPVMPKVEQTNPHGDAIRKAYRAGKRMITLTIHDTEVDLKIRKLVKPVSFISGGVEYRRNKSWLIAEPADGSLVPTLSIEFKFQGNMRSNKS